MPLAARKVVVAEPENSETPLDAVHGWVTPRQYFFVRNHFNVPAIDPLDYRLAVEGLVHSPAWWSLEELSVYPQRTVFATVECAGNGRSFLAQKAAGVQWGAGAIGHAEWTGVPLRLILERAGLKPGVTEILFEGADRGSESDHPEPMHFARSLPLEKAMHPDTLLATHMNGEPLEPSHGAPLRLFVPGWYGVASVKWLSRIEAIDHHFAGYFQTTKYTVKRRAVGCASAHAGSVWNAADASESASACAEAHPTNTTNTTSVVHEIVGPMAVKSEILRPRPGESLAVGVNRILGLAWAGEDSIAAVEISVDGGATWNSVPLAGPRADYSWCLWEYPWQVQQPGEHTILARAITTRGQSQPTTHDPLNGGYVINFSRPTPVEIRPASVEDDLSDPSAWQYDMHAFAEQNASVPLDVMMEEELVAGAGI